MKMEILDCTPFFKGLLSSLIPITAPSHEKDQD